MTLRLPLRAERMLQIRQGRASIAELDTRTFAVHTHGDSLSSTRGEPGLQSVELLGRVSDLSSNT